MAPDRDPVSLERADSYSDAFYQLGKLMGIPAQGKAPSEVWATQMLPRIESALQSQSMASSLIASLKEIAGYSEVNGMTRVRMRAIARAAIAKAERGA